MASALLAAVAAGISGCSSTVREGRSPAYLIVQRIEAASGAEDDKFSDELSSDVLTNSSVFEDLARVTFAPGAERHRRGRRADLADLQQLHHRQPLHVDFRRTDGRNTPGVDVPYGFEGAGTVTVTATDATHVVSCWCARRPRSSRR